MAWTLYQAACLYSTCSCRMLGMLRGALTVMVSSRLLTLRDWTAFSKSTLYMYMCKCTSQLWEYSTCTVVQSLFNHFDTCTCAYAMCWLPYQVGSILGSIEFSLRSFPQLQSVSQTKQLLIVGLVNNKMTQYCSDLGVSPTMVLESSLHMSDQKIILLYTWKTNCVLVALWCKAKDYITQFGSPQRWRLSTRACN